MEATLGRGIAAAPDGPTAKALGDVNGGDWRKLCQENHIDGGMQ